MEAQAIDLATRDRLLEERQAMRARRDAIKAVPTSSITLIYGAPCSGKTTYAADHAETGDLVIDYDAIAVALGSPDTHNHPRSLHPFVLHTIDALLERSMRSPDVKVWLIKCNPTAHDVALSHTQVRMATSREECKRRATEAGRPRAWAQLIDDWFTTHPQAASKV